MDWNIEESAKYAKSGRVDQLQVIEQALQNLIFVFDTNEILSRSPTATTNRKCLARVDAGLFFAKNIVVYRSLSHLLFCISAVRFFVCRHFFILHEFARPTKLKAVFVSIVMWIEIERTAIRPIVRSMMSHLCKSNERKSELRLNDYNTNYAVRCRRPRWRPARIQRYEMRS